MCWRHCPHPPRFHTLRNSLMTDRITIDPKILVGKPVVKGTRIAVELVVNLLANGWTQEQILDSYPHLTVDDIRACVAYSASA